MVFFLNEILVSSDYNMYLKCVKCLMEWGIWRGEGCQTRSSPGKLVMYIFALRIGEAPWLL